MSRVNLQNIPSTFLMIELMYVLPAPQVALVDRAYIWVVRVGTAVARAATMLKSVPFTDCLLHSVVGGRTDELWPEDLTWHDVTRLYKYREQSADPETCIKPDYKSGSNADSSVESSHRVEHPRRCEDDEVAFLQ